MSNHRTNLKSKDESYSPIEGTILFATYRKFLFNKTSEALSGYEFNCCDAPQQMMIFNSDEHVLSCN